MNGYRIFPTLGLMFAVSASPVVGAISFNQLSSCSQLQQFRSAIDAAPACQAPQRHVARILAERIRSWPGVDLCFRAAPPSDLLTAFDCTGVRMGAQANALLCIREIPAADIYDYTARHRQVYDALAKKYLDRAALCGAGNGDPSIMVPTMLPWIVSVVAEHEFGYVLPIGDPLVGSSAFVHGFGHLDPELGANRYVEYLFTWRNLQ